jgi:UDP-glucose 4-epimerase
MNITLLGATGLIGAEVNKVISLDHKVYKIGRNKDFSDQILDFAELEKYPAFDLPKSECLIHCAGVINEDFVSQNAVNVFKKSVFGVEAILKNAIAKGTKKFIYISSTHVYGDQEGVIDENNSLNPSSPYALAHYCSEQLFKKYSRIAGGNCVIIRPNAVYGIPLFLNSFKRPTLVPFGFPIAAKKYGKICLETNGKQKRNFVSTASIANIISRVIDGDLIDFNGNINPLGANTESIYQFAQRCSDQLKRTLNISSVVLIPPEFHNNKSECPANTFELKSFIKQQEPMEALNNYLDNFYRLI